MPPTFTSLVGTRKIRIDGDLTIAHQTGAGPEGHALAGLLDPDREPEEALRDEDELDFSFGVQNLSRFRGNVYKQRGCVAMAIRQIPYEIVSLEKLGLPTDREPVGGSPRGLVLVTGPTGSGKSTTLAAMIDKVNRERTGHIITIEDPIEFIHRHQGCMINQREVGADTQSFRPP